MADESRVEMPICRWAREDGWHVRKLQYIGRRACFDRLFFGHGRLVLIEFKDPGGILSPLQAAEWKRFKDAGVKEVYVVYTLEEGCRILGLRWPR